jgi:hypothetical protein
MMKKQRLMKSMSCYKGALVNPIMPAKADEKHVIIDHQITL